MSFDVRPPLIDWRGSRRGYRDLIANGVALQDPAVSEPQRVITTDPAFFDRAVMTLAMELRKAANHAADVRVIITRRNDSTESLLDSVSAGMSAIRATWRLGLVGEKARRRLERAFVEPTYLSAAQITTEVKPLLDLAVHSLIAAPRPGPAAGIAPAA